MAKECFAASLKGTPGLWFQAAKICDPFLDARMTRINHPCGFSSWRPNHGFIPTYCRIPYVLIAPARKEPLKGTPKFSFQLRPKRRRSEKPGGGGGGAGSAGRSARRRARGHGHADAAAAEASFLHFRSGWNLQKWQVQRKPPGINATYLGKSGDA